MTPPLSTANSSDPLRPGRPLQAAIGNVLTHLQSVITPLSIALIPIALVCQEPEPHEISMSRTPVQETPASPLLFVEVPDTSGLSYRNPDLRDRKTAKIRLPNGLEALLISDPGADQSSASLAVAAGSWHDPEEYPGMAHFCEHMLFLGTAKYPDPNFMGRVSDFGGKTNAYTAPDKTVYMFSAKTEGYLECLDRFAHFFIDPLFDQRYVTRELHAVDQEFGKNLEHDGWREYMVLKENCTPGHPHQKFSTGNSETLGHIPSSALIEWHKTHYDARKMRLFLYSDLPIETLQEQAAQLFGAVPFSETAPELPYQPILSDKQKGHITWIQPIREKRTLTLMWEIPPELSLDDSQPAALIAYALNRGQKQSLFESLKQEQLIDSLEASAESLGSRQNGVLQIAIELSQKGASHYPTVIQRCFEALALFKQRGVPEFLQQEMNRAAALSYEFQTRSDAFQMAQEIGGALSDEPLASFPRQQTLSSEYRPAQITALLDRLTPQECAIFYVVPPELGPYTPDQQEQWMRVPYTIQPVAPALQQAWAQATPNSAIQIPPPNPFLPERLEAIATHHFSSKPVLLSQLDSGLAYYCRAPEFSAPEVSIQLAFRSPLIRPEAASSVLTSLYLDHLTDQLHPVLAAAQSGGLDASFRVDKLKLQVAIHGFSDKAPLFLNEILHHLDLAPPTEEQFALYKNRLLQQLANAEKELPLFQARETLGALLISDRLTSRERRTALQQIGFEDYLSFHKQLWDKAYCEAMFAGNLTSKQAEKAWIDIQHALRRGSFPVADHPQPKVLLLPDQGGPFFLTKESEAMGNAAILAIEEGPFSLERRSAQDILGPALHEAFFNELRTKQKTGYIAKADPIELEEELFHLFMVQSQSHQPEDLLYRFELFLEEYLQTLGETLPLERYVVLRDSAIHSLKTRFRNLQDKTALWTQLAFEKKGNFDYVEKRIEALQSLGYEKFLELSRAMLARSNRKRLAILCAGRLNAPFSYRAIDAARLYEVSRSVAKGERSLEEPTP